MTADDRRCGYTVVDGDGIEQPCDRIATGWRWYQDVEHEDCLEPACGEHTNEGGERIYRAEAAIERVRELCDAVRDNVPSEPDSYSTWISNYAKGRSDLAADIRAALDGTEAEHGTR